MNVVLFDDEFSDHLFPITSTRPVAEIRTGILTISKKWSSRLELEISWLTRNYLRGKFPAIIAKENLFINGGLLPNDQLLKEILQLRLNEKLVQGEVLLAARTSVIEADQFFSYCNSEARALQFKGDFRKINYPWDIFALNGEEIKNDFDWIVKGRVSAPVSKTVGLLGGGKVFVEEGARMEFVTLNAGNGPIYIGKDVEIMEGAHIRGPFAILDGSQVKMGTKIYGPTTIGPYCKAGGELNNVVILGFTNKSHDGFLGNSVIGEWCNIGADTNSSNLKNNYADVKVWNYPAEKFIGTGLQFCGLIMGDHSKCGINTMFNTGTVVGVNCNIFGDGFPRTFIPDFSWGGPQGFTVFEPEKAFVVAQKVMERRNIDLSETEKSILQEIFDRTARYRKF
jgi:UDP-N-acetylglucosamine diphosphorylase/glucosamine-1-phosphate N-acetyltransferase